MNKKNTLLSTNKYPTSLIVRGVDPLGLEIAKSLLEQGGYVIIIDSAENGKSKYLDKLRSYKLLTVLDYSAIDILEDELRRLDYVFFLQHKSGNFQEKIATQEFLQFSNYLDIVLDLSAKFEAKFLLTTSVKAHQLIIADKQIDINFASNAAEKHTIYTELEIQRYSESLVKEYQDKVHINARIIRLGEIIGKDIEINFESTFFQIIIQAIQGKNLQIPGDGLETDFYIHSLDAAYGILKAQFSLNTKGKIFTLANDEEISILSIAYKLVDLIPVAGEIQFVKDNDQLPPIRLYKPAESLTAIGWKPRVNFNRALSQTIDYVKNRLLLQEEEITEEDESEEIPLNPRKSLFQKVKNLFFKEKIEEKNQEENLEGALARLIAERKIQDKSRKGSIILANSSLKSTSLKKESNSKFFKTTNNFFYKLKNRFNFLKNITVTDFIFYIIGFIALLIIYFQLISPIFSLGKNVFLIKMNLDRAYKASEDFNFKESKKSLTTARINLTGAQERINDLEFIFLLTKQEDAYSNIQYFLNYSTEYVAGYEEMLTGLYPVEEYLKIFNPEVKYTYSNSNILTVNSDLEYESTISEIKNNNNLINLGADKIIKSEDYLFEYQKKLPSNLKNIFGKEFEELKTSNHGLDFFKNSYKYLPEILAYKYQRNYLIVLQDSARYTAAGGDIAGFILLEVQNGAIKNINISTASQLTQNSSVFQFNQDVISEINLLSNKEVKQSNIVLSDLSLISDKELFLKTIEEYYSFISGKNIDITIGFSLTGIEDILGYLGDIEYQQIIFNDDNLLSSINILLGDNQKSSRREEIIMNISALIIEKIFNDFLNTGINSFSSFGNLYETNEVSIYTSKSEFWSLFQNIKSNNKLIEDKIYFGLNYDQISVNQIIYPNITIEAKVYVEKDKTTQKDIIIRVEGVENFQNTYICTPNGSQDFIYSEVELSLVTPNFSEDKICSIFLKDEDMKYGISFDTIAFETSSKGNYGLNLIKNSGVNANYYIEFTFNNELKVDPEDDSFIKQDQKYIYSGIFNKDNLNFNFNIE